jgi:hypothetical protein
MVVTAVQDKLHLGAYIVVLTVVLLAPGDNVTSSAIDSIINTGCILQDRRVRHSSDYDVR